MRQRGDAALLEYTERFDGVRPGSIRVQREEIARAHAALPPKVEESLRVAIENVREFHKREMDRSWELARDGATAGQRVRTLRRAGLYVARGHRAYPSKLMMRSEEG